MSDSGVPGLCSLLGTVKSLRGKVPETHFLLFLCPGWASFLLLLAPGNDCVSVRVSKEGLANREKNPCCE